MQKTQRNPSDNGLPETDRVVYEGSLSTLTNLYLFTNHGNLIYRPVHELVESKWKDVGQHLSQELGLAADESIIRVFALEALDDPDLAFLLATNDGFIKQVALAVKGMRDLKHSKSVFEACVEINRLENVGDTLRDKILAELFENEKDPIVVIKWKEIYQDAETITDICEDVAHVVDAIVVKQA